MAKTVKLNNGVEMPMLGMGTWHHGPKEEIQGAIKFAVKNGYRHIDCAHIYLNEAEVGETFKEIFDQGEVKREEMFIASKLWSTDHAPEHVEEGFMTSLKRLNLEYMDLYYIHWPASFKHGALDENLPKDADGRIIQTEDDFRETWKAMEKLVEKGLVKALGLCNFNTKQMKQIMEIATVKPQVLQVESNPRIHNEIIRQFCQKHEIFMVGFSSFGSPDLPWGEKLPHILVDETLKDIAAKYGQTTACVVLRWQIQRGVGVIPKSIIESELLDNLKCFSFELSAEDMKRFDGLNRNLRKIVPIVTLKDGTVEPRDKYSKFAQWEEEETEECLND